MSEGRLGKKFWLILICVILVIGGILAFVLLPKQGGDPPADRESAWPEEPVISGATWPTALRNDQSFGLRGRIVCRYPMTEIRGTVTNRVTGEVLFDVPVNPNSTSYKIGDPTSEIINDSLVFNSPACSNSWLNYRLTAQYERDGETRTAVLIDQNFKVGTPATAEPEQ